MSESFYDVLGVTPDASTEEITTAYRERIKETHPDVSDDENAAEQAKRVIEAKEVLTDDEERERYDRLGHDAYLQETTVDADWGGPDGSTDVDSEEDAGSTTTGTGTGATATGSGAAGSGPTGPDDGWSYSSEGNTWAGRREETRGRTAADVGTGEPGSGTAESGSESTTDSDGVGSDEESRQQSNPGNVGETVGWASSVDGRHAVRNDKGKTAFSRDSLLPPRQSYVLLISTFVCYPALVFSTFFPGFPLVVRLTIGFCTLVVVSYLMTMPEVGVYVFGGWSLLAAFGVFGSGVAAFSLLGVLILGSTWVPLFLTLATYTILQW